MGIEEMILERALKEGLKTGIEKVPLKVLEEGIEAKSFEVVKNLIINMGITDAQAAGIDGA